MVPAAWPEEKEPGRSPSGREVPWVRRGSTCNSLRVPRDSTYGHGAPRVTVALHIQPRDSTYGHGAPRVTVGLHIQPRDSRYGHGAPHVTVGLRIQPRGSTCDKGLRTGRAEVDAHWVGRVPLREVSGRVHVTELWTCTGATSL